MNRDEIINKIKEKEIAINNIKKTGEASSMNGS